MRLCVDRCVGEAHHLNATNDAVGALLAAADLEVDHAAHVLEEEVARAVEVSVGQRGPDEVVELVVRLGEAVDAGEALARRAAVDKVHLARAGQLGAVVRLLRALSPAHGPRKQLVTVGVEYGRVGTVATEGGGGGRVELDRPERAHRPALLHAHGEAAAPAEQIHGAQLLAVGRRGHEGNGAECLAVRLRDAVEPEALLTLRVVGKLDVEAVLLHPVLIRLRNVAVQAHGAAALEALAGDDALDRGEDELAAIGEVVGLAELVLDVLGEAPVTLKVVALHRVVQAQQQAVLDHDVILTRLRAT